MRKDNTNKNNNAKAENDHIFDNAFLSICAWDKRLLIPLVNVIFNRNIPEDAEIEATPNESFSHRKDGEHEKLIKRITDSTLKVENMRYHLECQSTKDGNILFRIAEYDMQIGLNNAVTSADMIIIRFPKTAVLYLRNHPSLPEYGEIKYIFDEDSHTEKVPYFKVQEYTLDYLSENHMYALLPFYLMRYENELKHKDSSKLKMIEMEAERVYNVVIEAYRDGFITQKECEDILVLCKDIVSRIGNRSSIKKRLEGIMGTEVLLTAEERGEVRGIKIGEKRGIAIGEKRTVLSLVNDGFLDEQVAADRLGISVKEVRKQIKEL